MRTASGHDAYRSSRSLVFAAETHAELPARQLVLSLRLEFTNYAITR